ncbi:MAG: flavodoxin [Chloroflexi bacterium HGW-Chloroflexi-10]|nr:MAG: flavodoxin [Chloroflexi bacterium HGW-Chloroflexi-10]
MKENKILITYATMSGSTQEIAEFVANELTHLGQPLELRPCREVNDLKAFSGIVIGAPLYMFHLHKDAQRFLQRHQKSLADLPIAVFAGGPYGPNAAQDALEVHKNLGEELTKFTWLKPVSVQLVGGRFDPARLRFPYNLIPALKQAPASDARNWEEIRSWVHSLPTLLAHPLHQALA